MDFALASDFVSSLAGAFFVSAGFALASGFATSLAGIFFTSAGFAASGFAAL